MEQEYVNIVHWIKMSPDSCILNTFKGLYQEAENDK